MEIDSHLTDPLKNYLDYYKKLKEPRFAVLVTGDWGSGKTYQVSAALDPGEYHHISLFGLKDDSAFYGAVLAKMDPEAFRRKRVANWAKDKSVSAFGFGFPIGGILSAGLDATVRGNVDNSKILVFDDYERNTIEPQVLLGLVNFYVEHKGCRVVIIAHDKKIIADFSEVKEKIIGQTIRIIPKTKEAIAHFITELEPESQEFIASHCQTIDRIIELSKCQSLRILRHILFDIARFGLLFTNEQRENVKATGELLSLFVAISIEVRIGRLGYGDLRGRNYSYMPSSEAVRAKVRKDEPSKTADAEKLKPIVESYNRYSEFVEITDPSLSNELLIQMAVDGNFDKASMQAFLKTTSKFAKPQDAPAWHNFMNFDTLPDTIVETAATRMNEQFKNCEISELGEFLHVVALRFMRAKNLLLKETPEKTVDLSKRYLDKLVTEKQFPLNFDVHDIATFGAYGGYGFWIDDSYRANFKEIVDYIDVCQERSRLGNFPKFKDEILNSLKIGGEEFSSLFTPRDNKRPKFSDVSVLASVEPAEFTNAFLTLPVTEWRTISQVLKDRKRIVSQDTAFIDEKKWFKELEAEMNRAATAAGNTIMAVRIKRHVPT